MLASRTWRFNPTSYCRVLDTKMSFRPPKKLERKEKKTWRYDSASGNTLSTRRYCDTAVLTNIFVFVYDGSALLEIELVDFLVLARYHSS